MLLKKNIVRQLLHLYNTCSILKDVYALLLLLHSFKTKQQLYVILCMGTVRQLFEVGLHILAEYRENMVCLDSSEGYVIGRQIVKPLRLFDFVQ